MRIFLTAAAAALSLTVLPAGTAWGFTPADAFAASRFDANSATVTNRYLPLTPGTQYVYEGEVVEDGETTKHRVVFTVTGLTKVVDGVMSRVILDQDYSDDELAEQEIAMFAQDTEGVVWNLGEYPEEFEDEGFLGAPSTWLSGVARARAGISMQAAPATGTAEYNQGLAPAIDFDDRGIVSETGAGIADALGSYTDGVVVKERSATEPDDGFQFKFHAPGHGVVRITAAGGDAQETLERTAARVLDAASLHAVNVLAAELDQRAYTHASTVWAGSAPVQGRGTPAETPAAKCPPTLAGRGFVRADGC